jgi:hypothetical protein
MKELELEMRKELGRLVAICFVKYFYTFFKILLFIHYIKRVSKKSNYA